MEEAPAPRTTWTFLTSHARVLMAISRDPWIRVRDLAGRLGLTERTVQAVVSDLESAGYLSHTREGRRNRYHLIGGRFRHPAEEQRDIAPLLEIFEAQGADGGQGNSTAQTVPEGRNRDTARSHDEPRNA
ncbi:MarR family protein [Streptomyces sp. SLBN-118]|uniref:helix-turn-helix transcriptional regulator n=1 Tax=Streptomyces sp. SLBN-118 TaxID=2768454 RepID=UPI001151FB02|nr:helix-turn-helix domain-containing protein [Streptomyces sp. SLBN-118]TQK42630.1 MarR family protein [Streptomyces sp. SLBN-118]